MQHGVCNDLLDHLVSAAEQRERDSEAKSLSGLEIYEQLDFGGLLDRQITGLLAIENSSCIGAESTFFPSLQGYPGAPLSRVTGSRLLAFSDDQVWCSVVRNRGHSRRCLQFRNS